MCCYTVFSNQSYASGRLQPALYSILMEGGAAHDETEAGNRCNHGK